MQKHHSVVNGAALGTFGRCSLEQYQMCSALRMLILTSDQSCTKG